MWEVNIVRRSPVQLLFLEKGDYLIFLPTAETFTCITQSYQVGEGTSLKGIRGKRPTRKQKELLRLRRLDPANWLVIKNLLHEGELHVKHRDSGRERIICRGS